MQHGAMLGPTLSSMHARNPTAVADEAANVFLRRLHGIAANGLPASVHDKLMHAAVVKSHDFLYQDTSIVSSSSKSSQWTYYKEKNGVLLCQGYSSSGDYMVRASVNASSQVGPLAASLDLGNHFHQVMTKIGKPWFHRGDTLGAIHRGTTDVGKPHDTAHLHWMTFGTEGAEYHDFIFLSHTKVYDSRRHELDLATAPDASIEFMTQLWDAVDLFPVPYSSATRVNLNRSGFLIERTHDRDVSRVSFILCAMRNRKREKWMERMAYTFVHEIAVMCRDVSVAVADHVEFGDELHCSTCLKTFTLFRRRHHCRLCTGAICNVCSTTVMLGAVERKSVRACLPCSTSSNESTLTRRLFMSKRHAGRSISEHLVVSSPGVTRSQHSGYQDREMNRSAHRSFDQQHPTRLSSPRSSQRHSRSSDRSGHMAIRMLEEDVATVDVVKPPQPTMAASTALHQHLAQHHLNMPKRSFRSSTTTTLSSQELSPPTSHDFSKFCIDSEPVPPHQPPPKTTTNAQYLQPLVLHEYRTWDHGPAHTSAYTYQDSTKECRPDRWRRVAQPTTTAFVEEEFDKVGLGVPSSPRNDLIPLPQSFGNFKRPHSTHQDDAARPSLISLCSDYEF